MKEIPITRGKVALVDDEDYEYLTQTSWCCLNNGYAMRGRKDVPELMHRIIMNAKDREYVDHINHNRLDNRKCNLRIATKTQNEANKKLQRNSTSGYKGVSLEKRTNRWVAYIGSNKNRKYLGLYASKEEAAKAYNKAAIELYGEFALLNEIKEV
jgi:hypothetical protein